MRSGSERVYGSRSARFSPPTPRRGGFAERDEYPAPRKELRCDRQLRTAPAVLGRRKRRKLAMLIHDDPLAGGPVSIVKHGEKIF